MARGAMRVAAILSGVLGVVAAILMVGLRGRMTGSSARRVELTFVSSRIRRMQMQAAAAAHARGAQLRTSALSMLAEEDGEEEEVPDYHFWGAGSLINFTDREASNWTECTSWRGCNSLREYYDINGTTEILPEQVQFECGGEASTRICYHGTMQCLDSAESFASSLYKVSPFEGSEMRTKSSCKCFSSNGCRPSCNVVLYQRWSANTGIDCPADPPKFHQESGVYQYGDPAASYVAPNDYSFDYYPEYPNPAGHVYDAAWSRNTYEAEPGIGMYQTPLLADYTGDDGTPA